MCTVLRILTIVYIHVTTTQIKINRILYPFSISPSTPHPKVNHYSDFYSQRLVLPITEFHRNKVWNFLASLTQHNVLKIH